MSIYDELKPLAAEILGEFKQGTIKLVRRVAGAGPIDNPGAATETETTLDAVAKGVTFRYVKDGFALSSDLIVTSAVVEGVTPTKDDFIDIDGTRYKIVEDISPPAAGTRVVWKFIVRK